MSKKKTALPRKAKKKTHEKTKKQTVFKTKSGKVLTAKQELFCRLYAGEREFFGNGVQAYAEAYGIDINTKKGYNVAKIGAHENLTKPNLLERITEILEVNGLNDENVDKQLLFLICQHVDLGTKMRAIQEYNKMHGRIIEKKDITSGGKTIAPIALVEFVKDDNATEGENPATV